MLHKNTLSTALTATLLTLGLAGAAVAAESTTTHGADSSATSKHAPDIKHDSADKKTAHMSKENEKSHKDSKKHEEEEQDESSDNEQEEAAEDSHKK